MSRPLSVAVLGFWHVHAEEYARAIQDQADATLAVVWDDDEARGREGAELVGAEFTADLDALLARDDIDAVTITTATSRHHEVILAAVRAGKHVFTEKLLAPTVEQAEEIIRAADDAGVTLLVALPQLAEAIPMAVKRLSEDGSLGTLTYTRIRMAHDGWVDGWLPERFADPAEAIGGALTDLGCHPAYLTQFFLGLSPATVNATYSRVTARHVEDNAVVTTTYANGAIGVIEASFVTTPGASTLEVRGTEGSVLYGFGSQKLIAKGRHFDPEAWQELPLPDASPDPFHQWIGHIRSSTRPDDNLVASVELTRLIAAANESALTGTTVRYS
jgi:1,5-anhydro-D-fructose reductase (1,5-anhydro-D-mannitol-forming)